MSQGYSQLLMLLSSRVIAQSFSDNITDLSKVRTTWTPTFATSLITEVDTVGNNLIGKKSKTALFEATDKLLMVISPARKDITSLKVQIDVDYKNNPTRRRLILSDLGYTAFYKKITGKSQTGTIGFLTVFNRNIETYKVELLANGTPAGLLDGIIAYADVVSNANMVQEQLKTTTKGITADAAAQLTALYDKIIGICKIAADHYKGNPAKKELFTFSKVASNLGYSPVTESTEAPQPPKA